MYIQLVKTEGQNKHTECSVNWGKYLHGVIHITKYVRKHDKKKKKKVGIYIRT